MKKIALALMIMFVFSMTVCAYADDLEVYTPLNNEIPPNNDFTIKWEQTQGSEYSLIAIREVNTDIKLVNNAKVYNYSYTISASIMQPGFQYKVWIANYSSNDDMLSSTIVYFTTRSNNVGYEVDGYVYLVQGSPTYLSNVRVRGTSKYPASSRVKIGASQKKAKTINAQVTIGASVKDESSGIAASLASSLGVSSTIEEGSSLDVEYYIDPAQGNSGRLVLYCDYVSYSFIREKKSWGYGNKENVTIKFPIEGTAYWAIEYS